MLVDGEAVCTRIRSISTGVTIGVVLIGVIAVGIALRKVHDAFFLRNEFVLLLIFSGPLGLFQYSISFFLPSLQHWTPVITGIVYNVYTVTGFVIPSIISIRNRKKSPVSTSSRQSEVSYSSEMEATGDEDVKGIDLLTDSHGQKYIEEFVTHYQMVRESRMVLFYHELLKFKSLGSDLARASKAFLIYQKFIQPEAYIHIDDVITDEEREQLKDLITKAVDVHSEQDAEKGDQGTISATVFDEILTRVKKDFKKNLIKPFLKSEFYAKYLDVVRLEKGLQATKVA